MEVSVFGPGYGECILIHAGDGDWIIVDSCIDVATRQAVAVDYLRRIGVDPSRAVKLVVATHWHDDHVRGMAATVDVCHNARFVCSDALNTREFLTLLKAFASRPMAENGSGLQELDGVVRHLETRAGDGSGRSRSPVWAAADRPLWRRVAAESSSGLQADVHALSPSDASNLAARLELQSLWPAEHRPKRRVMGTTPNLAAVVLLGYSGPTEDPARCGPGRNDGPASRVDGDSRFTHPAARRGDDVQGCAPWLGQRRSATDLARVARWEADGRAYSFSAERAQVADDCRRPAHPRAHLQRVYHGAAPTGSDARLTYRPTHAAAVGSVGP